MKQQIIRWVTLALCLVALFVANLMSAQERLRARSRGGSLVGENDRVTEADELRITESGETRTIE